MHTHFRVPYLTDHAYSKPKDEARFQGRQRRQRSACPAADAPGTLNNDIHQEGRKHDDARCRGRESPVSESSSTVCRLRR